MNLTKQQAPQLSCKGIKSCLVLLFTIITSTVFAQEPPKQDKGFSLSAALAIPLGDFASTHFLGVAAEVSPSAHTFSLLKQPKIAFTYNGGVAYYFGKKETVSFSPYKYPGFIFIHAFAGALYLPAKGFDIKLTGGPALGIYNGTTRFNIGSKLEASYHINNTISFGPAINIMKESGATSLWSASVKATMAL